MQTLQKKSLKMVNIINDRDYINNELEKSEIDYKKNGGVSIKDAYNDTVDFISKL